MNREGDSKVGKRRGVRREEGLDPEAETESDYSKSEHIMEKELNKSGRRTVNKRQIKRKRCIQEENRK